MKKMILELMGENFDGCTGCEACKNICPVNAIEMTENIRGESIPGIFREKCIECGKCISVCPVINEVSLNKSMTGYAAYRLKSKEIELSASGGIASVLGEYIIETGGNVWGVKYNKQCQPVFESTNSTQGVREFRGSKYVFPQIGYTYKKIGEQLRFGETVLFIGLPCQVAACKSFLSERNISMEKMISVDLLCHGAPPCSYLESELGYLIKRYKYEDVTEIRFRSNKIGTDFNLMLFKCEKMLKKWSATRTPYFYSFLKGITFREQCYNCKYRKQERVGDITLGDFPGFQRENFVKRPKDDVKNISLILVNTEKGKALLAEIQSEIELCERKLEEIYISCTGMKSISERNRAREKFLMYYYKEKNYSKAIRKTTWENILYNNILRYINYLLYKINLKPLKEK